jgi:hypothetical protein
MMEPHTRHAPLSRPMSRAKRQLFVPQILQQNDNAPGDAASASGCENIRLANSIGALRMADTINLIE